MARRIVSLFIIATVLSWAKGTASAVTNSTILRFEADVRPILKAHCFDCHGEGEKLNGGVDLRLRHFMTETKTDDGFVVVPEKPDLSVLLKVIESGEMPKKQKKLSTNELDIIRAWITSGANTVGEEPHDLPRGFQITEQERRYWAFQPIVRPPVPRWTKADRVRTSIDVFVLEKLREQHLDFAPEADKLVLIRRVYFDLLGLPPSPGAVDAFLADSSPDAYERLLDRVLEMPEYGERWGRHWLDTAGYSDSNGYAEADSVRADAWRYRDYVIRAMNTDKPWNDFVIEQLAGDELAGVTEENAVARAADSRVRELLAATGFLRMAPDGTGDQVPDQNAARNQVIAETLKIVSSSLLGLSVGCAQCHDHRYDPISQVDYYRLRSIFEPAMDWKNWRNPSQRLISLYTASDRKKAEVIEADARKIDEAAAQMRKEFLEKVFEKELAKLPEEIRESAKTARNTPGGKRSADQVALLKKYPSADVQGALDLYDPESNKKV
jgi:mono/diheme cytochrome c family protein